MCQRHRDDAYLVAHKGAMSGEEKKLMKEHFEVMKNVPSEKLTQIGVDLFVEFWTDEDHVSSSAAAFVRKWETAWCDGDGAPKCISTRVGANSTNPGIGVIAGLPCDSNGIEGTHSAMKFFHDFNRPTGPLFFKEMTKMVNHYSMKDRGMCSNLMSDPFNG